MKPFLRMLESAEKCDELLSCLFGLNALERQLYLTLVNEELDIKEVSRRVGKERRRTVLILWGSWGTTADLLGRDIRPGGEATSESWDRPSPGCWPSIDRAGKLPYRGPLGEPRQSSSPRSSVWVTRFLPSFLDR